MEERKTRNKFRYLRVTFLHYIRSGKPMRVFSGVALNYIVNLIQYCNELHSYCKQLRRYCKKLHPSCNKLHARCNTLHQYCNEMHLRRNKLHPRDNELQRCCNKLYQYCNESQPFHRSGRLSASLPRSHVVSAGP